MNIKLLLVLLVASLGLSTLVAAGKDSLYPKSEFVAIRDVENYLTKKLAPSSDDIREIMETVRAKLKKEDKGHMFRKKDKSVVNVLENLMALRIIDGSDRCSEQAFEILKRCDRLTDGEAHRKWIGTHSRNKRLVDKLVHYYATKRATECLPVYARQFETVMEKADSSFERYLAPFLSRVILRQICGFAPDDTNLDTCGDSHATAIEKLYSIMNFTPDDALVILEELLIRSSPNEAERIQDLIFESTRSKQAYEKAHKELKEQVEEQFAEPCRKFVRQFPARLFDQAEYDSKMLDMAEQSESLAGFHVGWANYRLCISLIAHPDWLGKFVLDNAAEGSQQEPSDEAPYYSQPPHGRGNPADGYPYGHHHNYPPPPQANYGPPPPPHYQPAYQSTHRMPPPPPQGHYPSSPQYGDPKSRYNVRGGPGY